MYIIGRERLAGPAKLAEAVARVGSGERGGVGVVKGAVEVVRAAVAVLRVAVGGGGSGESGCCESEGVEGRSGT